MAHFLLLLHNKNCEMKRLLLITILIIPILYSCKKDPVDLLMYIPGGEGERRVYDLMK